MSGFYLMHRGWQDNPIFRSEPFSRRDAFVWLIEEAAFRERSVAMPKADIVLARGQLAHSLRFMGKAWKWEETKVRRFLASLSAAKIIDAQTAAGQTLITICNYDKYQVAQADTAAAPAAAPPQHRRGTAANKKEGKEFTVPKGTGGEPPVDVVKLLFDEGTALLVSKGAKPSAARSMIGKWKNAHSPAAVLDAVREAGDRQIEQPIEWIGPYLTRQAAGGQHGAGETAQEFIARQAAQMERQVAESRRLAEMERLAVKPEDAAAIVEAARAQARATIQ
jgi:hypothetical protein